MKKNILPVILAVTLPLLGSIILIASILFISFFSSYDSSESFTTIIMKESDVMGDIENWPSEQYTISAKDKTLVVEYAIGDEITESYEYPLTSSEIEEINKGIQKYRFFDLPEDTTDLGIMDGSNVSITIVTNKREHTSGGGNPHRSHKYKNYRKLYRMIKDLEIEKDY